MTKDNRNPAAVALATEWAGKFFTEEQYQAALDVVTREEATTPAPAPASNVVRGYFGRKSFR